MRISFEPVKHVVLITVALVALFPIYFLAVNSVKDEIQFTRDPLFLPETFRWENYSKAWDTVARPIVNSTIIVSASVAGILVLSSLSAYAFSILRFPGRRLLFMLVFVLLLIPSVLTLIPLYLQIKRLDVLGISGGYGSLILPYVAAGQAFSIFVLKTFFDGISRELIDAARIDGAGDIRVYTNIVMPLSVPVLASVAIVNFIPLWNDYLLPSLLLGHNYRTLTMALVTFQGSAQSHSASNFGALMASYAFACIPLGIVFTFLMRYYVEGLTSGALKL